MTGKRPVLEWCRLAGAGALLVPATAQAQATSHQAADPASPAPRWVVTLSSGVLARDQDAARPFVVAGLGRKLGRGYVRVAATGFRSVVRQVDAVLPSSFALASVGAGGTFGRWFADASVSAGRQFYGGVTTALGTRASQAGPGSGVYGASLSGGRFIALARRLYLTPSAAVQFSADKALRSTLGPTGPTDEEVEERAFTGSATLRLDRFLGAANQHIAGLSISRVQTSNGAVALAASLPGAGDPGSARAVGIADGWYAAGASASIRMAPRLWLDGAATRTVGARSGDYATLGFGVRLGF